MKQIWQPTLFLFSPLDWDNWWNRLGWSRNFRRKDWKICGYSVWQGQCPANRVLALAWLITPLVCGVFFFFLVFLSQEQLVLCGRPKDWPRQRASGAAAGFTCWVVQKGAQSCCFDDTAFAHTGRHLGFALLEVKMLILNSNMCVI